MTLNCLSSSSAYLIARGFDGGGGRTRTAFGSIKPYFISMQFITIIVLKGDTAISLVLYLTSVVCVHVTCYTITFIAHRFMNNIYGYIDRKISWVICNMFRYKTLWWVYAWRPPRITGGGRIAPQTGFLATKSYTESDPITYDCTCRYA
jgi:hypothetical protein